MDRRLFLQFFTKAARNALYDHSGGKTITEDHIDYQGDYHFLLDMTTLGMLKRMPESSKKADVGLLRVRLGTAILELMRLSKEKGCPKDVAGLAEQLEAGYREWFA